MYCATMILTYEWPCIHFLSPRGHNILQLNSNYLIITPGKDNIDSFKSNCILFLYVDVSPLGVSKLSCAVTPH